MSDYANNMWARRIAAERAEGAKARAAAGLPSEQTVRDAMAASALDKVPRWADAVLQAVASPPVQPAAPTVAEPDAWAEEAERLALEYADVRSRQVVGDMNANPHRPERVKSALLAHLRSHPGAADARDVAKCNHCGMDIERRWVHARNDRRCADLAHIAHPPAAMGAAVSTSSAAPESKADRPDPKKCTALVSCIDGIITTKSCTTGQPLIDKGGSSDGERDYYECPDCGKAITIDYREN
jgi:hypothetical protein